MTPQERYGREFRYDRLAIRRAEGGVIICHQASVCITPSEDKEATLRIGWQVVRELALWLATTFDVVPEDERFQIIVGWSKSVRKLQGQIFKIWGFKERMREIASCKSSSDYASLSGDPRVPMPRWENDVFTQDATDSSKRRAAEIQDAIRQILLHDWNPIGIAGVGPDDEYDSYIAPVYRSLASSRSEQELIEFLFRTERDFIGMSCNSSEQLRLLARKLLALNVRL